MTISCSQNYLAPSGFRVLIDRQDFPNLEFHAQAVQHPNVAVNPVEVGYRRTPIALTGDTLDFGTLSMDVLLDEDMQSYSELYNWMEQAVEKKSDRHDYYDISVFILTSHNNVNKKFTYINAFPIDIGSISLAATDAEQYISFPVTFRYDYFTFT